MYAKSNTTKIRNFYDLDAWKQAHQLVLSIYLHTKGFPREEIFGLTRHLRKTVESVSSNIAEGFSRRTPKDKSYFYTVSAGSLTELQSQLMISKDLRYLDIKSFDLLMKHSKRVHMIINGMLRKMNTLKRY